MTQLSTTTTAGHDVNWPRWLVPCLVPQQECHLTVTFCQVSLQCPVTRFRKATTNWGEKVRYVREQSINLDEIQNGGGGESYHSLAVAKHLGYAKMQTPGVCPMSQFWDPVDSKNINESIKQSIKICRGVDDVGFKDIATLKNCEQVGAHKFGH